MKSIPLLEKEAKAACNLQFSNSAICSPNLDVKKVNWSNFTYVASHQSTKFTMLPFDFGKIHYGFRFKCNQSFNFGFLVKFWEKSRNGIKREKEGDEKSGSKGAPSTVGLKMFQKESSDSKNQTWNENELKTALERNDNWKMLFDL